LSENLNLVFLFLQRRYWKWSFVGIYGKITQSDIIKMVKNGNKSVIFNWAPKKYTSVASGQEPDRNRDGIKGEN
jgi:hypothetical protein